MKNIVDLSLKIFKRHTEMNKNMFIYPFAESKNRQFSRIQALYFHYQL